MSLKFGKWNLNLENCLTQANVKKGQESSTNSHLTNPSWNLSIIKMPPITDVSEFLQTLKVSQSIKLHVAFVEFQEIWKNCDFQFSWITKKTSRKLFGKPTMDWNSLWIGISIRIFFSKSSLILAMPFYILWIQEASKSIWTHCDFSNIEPS